MRGTIAIPEPLTRQTERACPDLGSASTTEITWGTGVVDDSSTPSKTVGGLRRILYVIVGGVLVGIGALGALLPGLPATPFLLLASFFFVRSSPQLNAQLLRSRFFGPILVDWQVNGGVRPGIRTKAICLVILGVGVTIYAAGMSLATASIVIAFALVGIVVILRLPTARSSQSSPP